MESFSKNIKKELCTLDSKLKPCCVYSFVYGFMFCSTIHDNKNEIRILNLDVLDHFKSICEQIKTKDSNVFTFEKNKALILSDFFRSKDYISIRKNIIKCQKCKESFLRGLFLSVGSVSDPEKSYRLEIVLPDEQKADDISELLIEFSIEALKCYRSGKYVLYLRKSELIEDFFANIGAASVAFEIMNSKIKKDLINNANRVTNCDAANINRALDASAKYINVISILINTETINMLPPHLQEMAYKRIEHKELNYQDLGKQFSPAISKSGVYHRLENILDFYEEFKAKKLICHFL